MHLGVALQLGLRNVWGLVLEIRTRCATRGPVGWLLGLGPPKCSRVVPVVIREYRGTSLIRNRSPP